MGATDGADPTTTLGGGSIVIHKDPKALLASGGVAVAMAGTTLTQEALNQAVDQAINYWRSLAPTGPSQTALNQMSHA
ncbi:MAG: hypothetical protein SGI77_09655 [Pirellulaceae bacterium]|nr:hypothetical protein [Pirellulaceae bacterium]